MTHGATLLDEHDAYEVYAGGDGLASVVLTCEHASERLPSPWQWPDADRRLLGTHWAVDLGARDLTLEFAALIGATAVCARFSRLLIDPNRNLESSNLFRPDAEGIPVALNALVSPSERARRIERCWQPYHRAVDTWVGGRQKAAVVSFHTFTPLYEGSPREVELGVLYDDNPEAAEGLTEHLAAHGWDARLNEPWSGKDGLMFSPLSHARDHGRPSLELEIRQDLSVDPVFRAEFLEVLRTGLERVGFLR